MSIHFSKEQWQETRENYNLWWQGKLKRPLINFVVTGNDTGTVPRPRIPAAWLTPAFASVEEIMEGWDYQLAGTRFIGDSFPNLWPNFGPGVIAAFMGAELVPGEGTYWFKPLRDIPITERHFYFDPEAFWFKKIQQVYEAAYDRWGGMVQLPMTDLGGNLDILSTFYPSEQLPMELYDHPDDVKRLTWEAHEAWWKYYGEFNKVISKTCPGYSDMLGMFSPNPCYVFQCDFCYMISPDQFEEFVKPEIEASCKKIPNTFYHLDGKGQLPHLDSLLRIKELKGIQWVPGAGMPEYHEWPEVYRKIRDAGKLMWLCNKIEYLDRIAEQLGSAEGIYYIAEIDKSREGEAREILKRYGVR